MCDYIGLDVSLKETGNAIRRDKKRVWRGKCASEPALIAEVIRKQAPNAELVVFETGPLSIWFYHALTEEGLPVKCIDARHAANHLKMSPNKTDANDADGLAELAEVGFYKEVRVKDFDSMLTRTLVAARNTMVEMITKQSNQIRGLLKTFGLVVGKAGGDKFEAKVRELVSSNPELEKIILPVLEAWRALRQKAAKLTYQLLKHARTNVSCQLLMSIPGVGAITASAFVAAVEEPENFSSSRAVGAWVGLTPRRYQSGEINYGGRISKRGDKRLRALLYEAATVHLTGTTGEGKLRLWGLALRERVGFKRAAVAVARKLAVIMHTMLKTGELFDGDAAMAN